MNNRGTTRIHFKVQLDFNMGFGAAQTSSYTPNTGFQLPGSL
ncbi:hypothetical protein [Salinicoccus albus]|nr:hypothetical protein [Salinicoccus albus]